MTYFYDCTKYPKIYDATYWGHFKAMGTHYLEPEIVENRNNFINDYHIKKVIKKLQKFEKHIIGQCDHLEYYITTEKKQILICSPYSNFDSFSKQPFLEKGWIEIPPMYSRSATTFMKEI
ncbi:MAG: hypothetical protein WCI60_04735 [bacterium]